MAGNEGILRHAPFVIQHREIGMADAAVSDLDFHFLRTKFARIKGKWFQRTFGSFGSVSIISRHGF